MRLSGLVAVCLLGACSNNTPPPPDAASCANDPNAVCGATGGTYTTTTTTCTGAGCSAGSICLSLDASLSCFQLSQVCAESVGAVSAVIGCNSEDGGCPPLMLCDSQKVCVPDCTQLEAGTD